MGVGGGRGPAADFAGLGPFVATLRPEWPHVGRREQSARRQRK